MCDFTPYNPQTPFYSQMASFMTCIENTVSYSNKSVHSDIVTSLNKPFVVINVDSPKQHSFLFPETSSFDEVLKVIADYYSNTGSLLYHNIPLQNLQISLKQMHIIPSDLFVFKPDNVTKQSKEIYEFANEFGISTRKVQKYIDKGIITPTMLKNKLDAKNDKLVNAKAVKKFKENPLLLQRINNTDFLKKSFGSYVNGMLNSSCHGLRIEDYLYITRYVPVLFNVLKQNVFDYVTPDNIITISGCLIVLPTLLEYVNTSKKLDKKASFINEEMAHTLKETLDLLLLNESPSDEEILLLSLISLLLYVISLIVGIKIEKITAIPKEYLFTAATLFLEDDSLFQLSNVFYQSSQINDQFQMQDDYYHFPIRRHQSNNLSIDVLNHLESPILRILFLEDHPIERIENYLPNPQTENDKIDKCEDFCFIQKNSTMISSFIYALMGTELIIKKPQTAQPLVTTELNKLQNHLRNNPLQPFSVGYMSSIFKQLQTQETDPTLSSSQGPTFGDINLMSCLEIFIRWISSNEYSSNFNLYPSFDKNIHLLPDDSERKYVLLAHQNTTLEIFLAKEMIPKDYFIVAVGPGVVDGFPIQFENSNCHFKLNSAVFSKDEIYRAVIRKNGGYIVCENKLKTRMSELEMKLSMSGMSEFRPKILIYKKVPLFDFPTFPYPNSYVPLLREVIEKQGTIQLLRKMEKCYKNVTKQEAYVYLKEKLLNETNPFEYLNTIDWYATDAKIFRKFLREAALRNPKNAELIFKQQFPSNTDPEALSDIADMAASCVSIISSDSLGSELISSILSIPSSHSFEQSEAVVPLARFLRAFLPYTLVNEEPNNPFRKENVFRIENPLLSTNALKAMLIRDEQDTYVILNYLSWNNQMWTENILTLLEIGMLDDINYNVFIRYAWEMFGLEDDLKEQRKQWMQRKLLNCEINNSEIAGIIVEIIGGGRETLENCRSVILKELIEKYPKADKLKQMSYNLMLEKKDCEEFSDFKDTRLFNTFIKCLIMINKSERNYCYPVCTERSVNKMASIRLQAIQLNNQINGKD